MTESCKSQNEIAIEAINNALQALKKQRHLLEEAVHALSRPIVSQDFEWKENEENLEMELQQCYKAQSLLYEQLVKELSESRVSKALLQEKENAISDMQKELIELREQKIKEVELVVSKNSELKAQLKQMTTKANEAEAGIKLVINSFVLEKMKDADRINEGFEWKEKAENLEVELQQCYKAQSQLSEQFAIELQQCYKAQSQMTDHLAMELSESRASKALLQEKENAIADMQELTELREQNIKEVELVVRENSELKAQLEQMTAKANEAEIGNKLLNKQMHFMKTVMFKTSDLEQLARQQVLEETERK